MPTRLWDMLQFTHRALIRGVQMESAAGGDANTVRKSTRFAAKYGSGVDSSIGRGSRSNC